MINGLMDLKAPLVTTEELSKEELVRKKNKRDIEIFAGIVSLLISVFFLTLCGFMLSTYVNHKELAKEVRLEQVSVKGKNIFDFEGRITFNNGEVESVVLKKGTTKKEG
ncbi:MAG: hypothetical protein WA019_02560 [Candidatus Moraniibacteriota bacterium]